MAKDLINQLYDLKDQLVNAALKGFEQNKIFRKLVNGQLLNKYTFQKGKKQPKEFLISADLQYFMWKLPNSNRKIRKFLINDIKDIIEGNDLFSCKIPGLNLKNDLNDLCFTVVMKQRNVDIVTNTKQDRDNWVLGLNLIKGNLEKASKTDIEIIDNQLDSLKSKILSLCKSNLYFEDIEGNSESSSTNAELNQLKSKLKHLDQEKTLLDEHINLLKDEVDKKSNDEQLKKRIISQRDKQIKDLESQLELLHSQFENLEKDYSQRIFGLEEKLTHKDSALLSVRSEYEEFKKQIKDSFNKTLVQKIQQYRESKEVLCSYVAYLKQRLDSIEKEVALWQAVVHTHVLPVFQAKKPGRMPQFKEVLAFGLDIMERKLDTDRSQTQFITLLTEARKHVKSN